MKHVFAIEGLDRLGKSSLIEGILNTLGYYEVIHFSKPKKLNAYAHSSPITGVPNTSLQSYHYQQESFRNSMIMAKSGARIIFDRWHLGEAVYSPMYRAYSGDYVFDFEKNHHLDSADIRLILLTEDFSVSRHFVDDGESLGGEDDRMEEQNRFVAAFNRSIIRDKRIISVTDPALGGFKPKDVILSEALS